MLFEDVPIRTWINQPGGEDAAGVRPIVEPAFLARSITPQPIDIGLARRTLIPDFDAGIVTFGTCFAAGLADDMGKLGLRVHWQTEISQHFSPATLADALERAAGLVALDHNDLITTPGGMVSPFGYKLGYDYARGPDRRESVLDRLRELGTGLVAALRSARLIMVTLGTARVVRLTRNHRAAVQIKLLPDDWWYTQMMSVDETVRCLERIHGAFAHICGGAQAVPPMILTVSPQRYLFTSGDVSSDPFVDNSVNKATLRLAVERFIAAGPARDITYFPSYEIVLDELRVFEPLQSVGDHAHIGDHTRPYVLRKFFRSYAAPEVVEQLNLIAAMEAFIGELQVNLPLGLQPTEPQLMRKFAQLIARTEALGVTPSGRLVECIARLIEHVMRDLEDDARFEQIPGDAMAELLGLVRRGNAMLEKELAPPSAATG